MKELELYVFGYQKGINMLSLRRLLGIIIVTISVSILLLMYGLEENNLEKVVFENNIPQTTNLLNGDLSIINSDRIFYIVGENNQIFNNTVELFNSMGLAYKTSKTINTKHLNNNSILVFTSEKISDCADLQDLESYIKNGGQAILAAGLAESNDDSYLQPILGIVEKTIKENYNDFFIKDGFLPFMETKMNYSGYNLSTWIKTKNEATVFISDLTKNVPIVYSNNYGDGEVIVINASFLEDKKSMGILCGSITILLDDFIYPIMGTKSVFLDNFPVTNNSNDGKSMKMYGRTINSLVRDKIWPVFQGISARNGLKITSSVLVAASLKDSFPELTNNLFYTISKSSMQYDGEVVYAGNFYDDEKIYINNKFSDSFNEVFNKYIINGFAVQFGIFNEKIYSQIKERFNCINIIRGNLTGNEKDTYICTLGKNDEYYNFPTISYGDELDNGTLWDISSMISSQGFLSHLFDINVLMGLEEGNKTWNERIKYIDDFEDRVLKPLKWLESCTLSENIRYIDGYINLKYRWKVDDDVITLVCDDFIENQAFYFRTDKLIEKIEGAEYLKINDYYYLLKIKDSVVKINLKK